MPIPGVPIPGVPKLSVTDSELIQAARAGDKGAWGELYARWLPWVWRYAYSLVGDRHAAEDVTSDAMTAWVRRLHESDAEAAQLAGWLRTVVRNKSADHVRRLVRQRKAMATVAMIDSGNSIEPPTVPLERCEMKQQVNETLNQLPERHRLVLEWKYAEGLSVRQIASRLGVTEKSVEATLYRARREFRQKHETVKGLATHDAMPAPDMPTEGMPTEGMTGEVDVGNARRGCSPVVATETNAKSPPTTAPTIPPQRS